MSPCSLSTVSSRSKSKESIPTSSSTGTASGFEDRLHCTTSTKALTERIAAIDSSTFSLLTASTLFSRTLSAKATCCAGSLTEPSDLSRVNCVRKCAASTTVRIPSILQYRLTTGSRPNVLQTGPGSAIPVVSISMPSIMASSTPDSSRSSTEEMMLRIAATRSSRKVQQRQPLSRTVTDSIVDCTPTPSSSSISSMAASPNSFSMTAYFLPCWLRRM
mmetsp:Transcript_34373/g.77129  ORF Transcript_34373/g.77129 Transcript_34373/m.77129 type:complete len:218 (-) Transcript_34373:536-1189(-)